MISLRDLLSDVKVLRVQGPLDRLVGSLCIDHRRVVPDTMFIALCGTQVDGHTFVSAAIEAGARCLLVQDWPAQVPDNCSCIQVAHSAVALGLVASAFHGKPSEKLTLVGVTGTNGKTTTVTLLHQLFSGLGYRSGLISTVSCRVGTKEIPSTHTTPDAIQINDLLAQMVQEGCTHAFMEVSSHAMAQHRVSGLHFAGGIFTNLTRDHLDYHGTMENYFMAKRSFFDGLGKEAFALFNANDPYANAMVGSTSARCFAFGLESEDQEITALGEGYFGKNLVLETASLSYQVEGHVLTCGLSGKFNAYNTLAVYATGRLLGCRIEDLLEGMQKLTPPNGRMQSIVGPGGRLGMVDYAHTPDALEQVLLTLQAIKDFESRLITVVGCGGDRDRGKRPLMAAVVFRHSDAMLFTSDNPRNEDPEHILNEMMAGISEGLSTQEFPSVDSRQKLVIRQADRAEAIRLAVQMTASGDILLVAGKGHEAYQEIRGVRYPFNDAEQLQHQFEKLETLEKEASSKG
ncbi:MAG: UDP-N-acetylmuramoyl-L-alanyl-D-glutamate--2,6-diaminopimelate ligase [Sphingomonadales bacterium]|nr:UDP-N-acetylmuramoyl-L-alanyl-D-glutamate--2,6-diaminopimelate ligase [Sphingomonadales bacterium]